MMCKLGEVKWWNEITIMNGSNNSKFYFMSFAAADDGSKVGNS